MQSPGLKDDLSSQAQMNGLLRAWNPFAVACASGLVATVCIQPIDMLKVQMELKDQGHVMDSCSQWPDTSLQGRPASLYQGLSAGLLC